MALRRELFACEYLRPSSGGRLPSWQRELSWAPPLWFSAGLEPWQQGAHPLRELPSDTNKSHPSKDRGAHSTQCVETNKQKKTTQNGSRTKNRHSQLDLLCTLPVSLVFATFFLHRKDTFSDKATSTEPEGAVNTTPRCSRRFGGFGGRAQDVPAAANHVAGVGRKAFVVADHSLPLGGVLLHPVVKFIFTVRQ